MVSCEAPSYDVELVRLIHGDTSPDGPGYREEPVRDALPSPREGRIQAIHPGSYARVQDAGRLDITRDFTLQAWIYPTTPSKGLQGLLTNWSPDAALGFGLVIGEASAVELWIGAGQKALAQVSTGVPLRPHEWYFVAGSFSGTEKRVSLVQGPLGRTPDDPDGWTVHEVSIDAISFGPGDFLLGATWIEPTGSAVGLFNGKIDGPRVYRRALSRSELDQLRVGKSPSADDLVAAWDLSVEPGSNRIVDVGPWGLHGDTVQLPTRAVTGHNWTGFEPSFRHAASEYGAIHFHDDDLENAGWEPDIALEVSNLRSGLYALRLSSGEDEYHVPFVVRPKSGQASADLLLLLPTLTYLAYANERQIWNAGHLWAPPERIESPTTLDLQLAEHPEVGLSLYDLHSDGTGVCYSSFLRPILNLSPRYRSWLTSAPRHLSGDLYLIDWLEAKGITYDVVADSDLHDEGSGLLAPYRAVVTGSHPEYWTEAMLDGLEHYLDNSGRVMYLGGNGFYWVTSVDPHRPHVIEVRRGPSGTRAWEGLPGEGFHCCTGEPGGLWRHRARSPNALVGVGFAAEGWDKASGYVRQPASFRQEVSWIFDRVESEGPIGCYGLALGGAAGDEIDRADGDLGTPPQAIVLATATDLSDYYQLVIEDILAIAPGQGGGESNRVRADMTYLERPGGGAVFSTGSITWSASLSHNGYDNDVSRITENVLRRFLETTDAPPSHSPRQ